MSQIKRKIYKANWFALLLSLTVLQLNAQECTVSNDTGNSFGNATDIAQSFIPCSDGTLNEITLFANTITADDATVFIYEGQSTDAMNQLGTIVISGPIPEERVNGSTVAFFLDVSSLNIDVLASTTYTFRVQSSNGELRDISDNVYADGEGTILPFGFGSFTDLDYVFDVDVTLPEEVDPVGPLLDLTAIAPSINSFNVANNSNIVLTFDNPVDATTLNDDAIFISGNRSGKIAGSFSGGGTSIVTFDPTDDFITGEDITVTVTHNLRGDAGEVPDEETYQFKTGGPEAIGTFELASDTISSTELDLRETFVADIDNDGDLDIFAVFNSGDRVSWFENDGIGGWTEEIISNTVDGVSRLAVADFNNDGRLDIAVAEGGTADQVIWFSNDNTGTWPSEVVVETTGGAVEVAAGDIDSDGDMDIIASIINPDRQIVWYENRGPGIWIEEVIYLNLVNRNSESIETVDMDNDGDLDLLVVSPIANLVHWFENDGIGTWTETVIVDDFTIALDAKAGDLDGDGDIDVVAGDNFTAGLFWYESSANGTTWTEHLIDDDARSSQAIDVADIDGDGDLDIINGNSNSGMSGISRITLYDNNTGDGENWVDITVNRDGNRPTTLQAVDMDGDGDLDIVSSTNGFNNMGDDVIRIYTNDFKTVTWTGASNDFWTSNGNWDTGELPIFRDNVLIPASSVRDPRAFGTNTINGLEIETGAILEFPNNQATLILLGDLQLDGEIDIDFDGSLIIHGDVSGSGSASISRPGIQGNQGLSMIGSPIMDATVADLNSDFNFAYDEATNTYSSASGLLTPGKGIFIGYETNSPTLEFVGLPNSGEITFPLSMTGTDDAFNIIANPYTSALDREAFITTNNGVLDGNIWLWDDGGSNVGSQRGGDFIVVNNMGSITTVSDADGVAGSTGNIFANDALSSMQGFFVNATSNANVVFNPDMQIESENNNTNFFRNEDLTADYSVKLSLSNSKNYNEILIGFREDATHGRDFAMDAPKLVGNEDLSFYSYLGTDKFSIQALPLIKDEEQVVGLGMDLSSAGTFKINVTKIGNSPDAQLILVDTETNVEYALKSDTEIEFETTGAVNTSERFKLTLRPHEISVVTESLEEIKDFHLYGNTDQLTIQAPLSGVNTLVIHTLSGAKIFDQQIEFDNNTAIIKPTLSSNQLYVLKITGQTIKFRLK